MPKAIRFRKSCLKNKIRNEKWWSITCEKELALRETMRSMTLDLLLLLRVFVLASSP